MLDFQKIRPFLRKLRVKVSAFRQIGIAAIFVFLASAFMGILRAGQESGSAKPSGPAAHGVELTILDKTCKPCEDFYHYASGEWLAKNPVPRRVPELGTLQRTCRKKSRTASPDSGGSGGEYASVSRFQ